MMNKLRSKQLLRKLAELSQIKVDQINKKEIEKNINKIKYLSDKKKISKTTLKKEIIHLEEQLKSVLALEKKLNKKEDYKDQEIEELKKQIKSLKKKVSHTQNKDINKKINKLSHLVGDLMAHEDIKKEIKKIPKKEKKPKKITLELINQFQKRIIKIKKSGKFPPERINALENRLTELEKKLIFPEKTEKKESTEIKHKMLFGPQPDNLNHLKEKEIKKTPIQIEELPLPPPPIIKKKKKFF